MASTRGGRQDGDTAGPMRVLHVVDSGGLYGAERVILDLAAEHRRLGLEPSIASIARPGDGRKPIETAAREREIRVFRVAMRSGPNPVGALRLLRLARDFRADVIHTHGYKGEILLGFLPRRLLRVPLVCTLHGWTRTGGLGRMAVYEWFGRHALLRADAVVLVHAAMKQRVGARMASMRRYVVIENGIPPIAEPARSFRPDDRVAQFCRDAAVVGAIGRLSPEKGLRHLVSAFAILARRGSALRLAILGEGAERPALEAQVSAAGIGDRVLLAGFVENARDYLPLFSALVLPSLTEGLPLTLLEAMQAGVPVVATAVGGVPDALADGVTGLLVPPADPAALADAVRRLLDDPGLAARLAGASRREVARRFGSAGMALRYAEIYRDVTSAGGAGLRGGPFSGALPRGGETRES